MICRNILPVFPDKTSNMGCRRGLAASKIAAVDLPFYLPGRMSQGKGGIRAEGGDPRGRLTARPRYEFDINCAREWVATVNKTLPKPKQYWFYLDDDDNYYHVVCWGEGKVERVAAALPELEYAGFAVCNARSLSLRIIGGAISHPLDDTHTVGQA
jgi:hypothetical protein